MWTYQISKGIWTNGQKIIHAYSGNGEYKNDPSKTGIVSHGPIPIGLYAIGTAYDTQLHGPCVMRLTPQAGTDTKGRSGFLFHGDSIAHPGDGSEGCIVTMAPSGRPEREYVNQQLDKELRVIA